MAEPNRIGSLSRVTRLVLDSPLFVRRNSRLQDLEQGDTDSAGNFGLSTISGNLPTGLQNNNHESDNIRTDSSARQLSDTGHYPLHNLKKLENPPYLKTYFKCLYFMGISCYKVPEEGATCISALVHAQKAAVWLFSMIAVIHFLKQAKFFALNFATEGELLQYVTFAFFVINLIGSAYFVKVLVGNKNCIHDMLKEISEHRNNQNSVSVLAITLAIASWFCALILCAFGGLTSDEYSLKTGFLRRSYDMAHDVFVWNSDNETHKYVNENYGHDVNINVIVFGTLENFFQLCGNLQDYVFGDLILLAALTLYKLGNDLNTRIYKTLPATDNPVELALLWKEYTNLKRVSKGINECIGGLLTFMHFKNILLFGYTLYKLLKKRGSHMVRTVLTLYKILKSLYTYFVAVRSARMNSTLRSWIHERSHLVQVINIDVDRAPVQAAVLLDELKMNPIGLGEGTFHIDIEFILKLATLIVSYFMFLAKESED